jgi:hypothetical protein
MQKPIQIICTLLSKFRKPNGSGAVAPNQLVPPAPQQILSSSDFWHELNADYYNTFLDSWENGDLYLQGANYERMLEREGGEIVRMRHSWEQSDGVAIYIGNWKIWQVGRTYAVADRLARPDQLDRHVLGKLVLVGIRPGALFDWLTFRSTDWAH